MPQNSGTNDDDLLRRMREGDEEAFTALYRRHQGAVYRFALQMSGKSDIAEEVTQEVFMLFMRDRKQYDPGRGPVAAYLYGVARKHVLRALDREKPYATSIDDDNLDDWPAAGPDVLVEITRAEQVESLRQAILSLPALYREVIVLCELHELDYVEAATVIQCPVGTVRSRLNRARAMLVWKMRASERCPA